MSQNKRPTVYVVKEEIKAMGAAQIMLGLIHSALGSLWLFLYHLEDEKHSVGPVLMSTAVFYLFVSGSFFINSGSSSVVQGDASACQLVLGIVMNTISIFVAIMGIIIFAVEFPAFEALGKQYIWSNMAGMMLLQISIFCTITELVITIIAVDLFRNAFHQPRLWDELIQGDPRTKKGPPPAFWLHYGALVGDEPRSLGFPENHHSMWNKACLSIPSNKQFGSVPRRSKWPKIPRVPLAIAEN
ncbi:uncharacterized protein LOC121677057 [Arvicola amphibius]|uniref:uncharacterized protein LOC121677057 n=1 Tax=Arvicola amphibius TaxID=1047088 RepID=UPI001C089501|nr:uncharacterized protein LOC121677057 [Arvicola amphibius]